MAKFLKNFGLGLLLMIFSPLLVALVALAMVGGLLYFLFASAKGLVRFFMGLKWFKPLEIDLRVQSIKEQLDMASSLPKEEPAPAPAPAPSGPVYVQNNYYNSAPPSPPPMPTPSIPEPTPSPLPLDVEPQNPAPNPAQISQTPSYPYEELTHNIEEDETPEREIITKEVDE